MSSIYLAVLLLFLITGPFSLTSLFNIEMLKSSREVVCYKFHTTVSCDLVHLRVGL